MRYKTFSLIAIAFNLIAWNQLLADSRIVGQWAGDDGSTIEVLDGFKVSTGPILMTDAEGQLSTGSWKVNDDESINIEIGWSEYPVKFINPTTFEWGYGDIFTKSGENEVLSKISLKDSPNDFVGELVQTLWTTSSSGGTADFSITFTNESGVVVQTDIEGKTNASSWSIASDVLKLGDSIIIEASISSAYFIGLDSYDDFIVFKSVGESSVKQKTSMNDEREEFFDQFLTGTWVEMSYGDLIVKFRPIFGELKGKVFDLRDDRLVGHYDWEYSPSTGALNMYGREYIQAKTVGDTLVLLNTEGDQAFFIRDKESNGVRYTLADVKQVPLNENSLPKIEKELSGQFQYEDDLYLFEFSDEKRTGFVHKFMAKPFSITGETFSTELMNYESNVLYMVEDFVLFGGHDVFKRDASHARLKVKSEKEIEKDAQMEGERIKDLTGKQLFAVITLSDGSVVDVPLGIPDLNDVEKIELVVE